MNFRGIDFTDFFSGASRGCYFAGVDVGFELTFFPRNV